LRGTVYTVVFFSHLDLEIQRRVYIIVNPLNVNDLLLIR
jgi:hypothetical protein